jgi:ATP-dependent DNA ligase
VNTDARDFRLPPRCGFVEPCLPTISRTVPTGPGWAYEIKHDGFRFVCVSQRKRVRVFSRGGHDWSKQLPTIVEAVQGCPSRRSRSTARA